MTSTSSGRSAKPGPARQRRRTYRPRPPRALREAGLNPRKSLGQHFLVDARTIRRIADACELDKSTDVIEVGPGLGALTAELATRARRVIAIELDRQLAARLERKPPANNVSVINDDILEVDFADLLRPSTSYVITGNLPYNVAQPILRHVMESTRRPKRLIVMVQAEVAQSIVARTGEMTLLGISVQLYGEPRLLFRVPPSAFYPPPKVRSAVVRVDIAPSLRAGVEDTEGFFRVARAGFSTKRKQLRNALANGLGVGAATSADLLAHAGIDPTLRAQALGLDQWAALASAWMAAGRPESKV